MTMNSFSADELSGMQLAQEDAMQDQCSIRWYSSSSTDEYGRPVVSFSDALVTKCGYFPGKQVEVMEGTQVVLSDAAIRLPLDLQGQIDHQDRVVITHRFGQALVVPVLYQFLGEPNPGPSGLVGYLRLVTNPTKD